MNKGYFDYITDIIYSDSLSKAGEKIVEYTTEALKEKNCKHIVEQFYQNITVFKLEYDNPFGDILNKEPKKHYKIIHQDKHNVVGWYIYMFCPRLSTPKKTLKELQVFGYELKNNFNVGNNNILNLKEAEKVMEILDREYNLSNVLFKEDKLIISIANEIDKNTGEDGTLYTTKNLETGKLRHYIFLRQLNEGKKNNCSFVLIHELAHALHTLITNFPNILVHDIVLEYLSKTGFPTIKELTIHEQNEIFADALSSGMIYSTELEKYDRHKDVFDDYSKKMFHDLFLMIFDGLKKRNELNA